MEQHGIVALGCEAHSAIAFGLLPVMFLAQARARFTSLFVLETYLIWLPAARGESNGKPGPL